MLNGRIVKGGYGNTDFLGIGLTLMIFVFVTAGILGFLGRSDPIGTKKILADQGYTSVVVLGFDSNGCLATDYYKTKFTAVSPNGNPVSGVVCGNWHNFYWIRLKELQ